MRVLAVLLLLGGFSVQVGWGQTWRVVPLPTGGASVATDDLWHFALSNPGATARARVQITVTDDADRLRWRAESAPFDVPPGEHLITPGDQARLAPVRATWYGGEHPGRRTLPAGRHEVCVRILSVAEGALAEGCGFVEVMPRTPPLLVAPTDADAAPERFPVFYWTPPAPLAEAPVTYRLKLVEMLDNQSAWAAITSNPAWFVRDRLPAPMLAYPPEARPLDPRRRYAWTVWANVEGEVIPSPDVWTLLPPESRPREIEDPLNMVREPTYAVTDGANTLYPTDGTLHLAVDNRWGSPQLTLRFAPHDAAETTHETTIAARPGRNYFTFGLDETGLKPATTYDLFIDDASGRSVGRAVIEYQAPE
ncbi:MAG: hypothetical protein WBA12_00980 [Catalinimonas sp.]